MKKKKIKLILRKVKKQFYYFPSGSAADYALCQHK